MEDGLIPSNLSTITQAEFSIAPFFPVWVYLLLAAGAAALIYFYYRRMRERTDRRVALGAALLRAGSLALLIVLSLNPIVRREWYQKVVPYLVVLSDSSESMSLPAGDGEETRLAYMNKLLDSGVVKEVAGEAQVVHFTFDREARLSSGEGTPSPGATGSSTRIIPSLWQALERLEGAPVMGVILMTDGRDEERKVRDADLLGLPPVMTLAMGDPTTFRDIRLTHLRVPDFAFLHKPVPIEFDIEGSGYKAVDLLVSLKREGEIVQTKLLSPRSNPFSLRVAMEFVPDSIGEYALSVGVPVQEGEAVAENNRIEFTLPVIRDKIRILMTTGSPSWNYRFFRRALKADPTVDLISFVILRSPFDLVNVPQDQLSLIPFPTDVLFTSELQNFDLVIFDNFSFRLNLPTSYMVNVRDYVAEGGAFAMFGGTQSFGAGEYQNTPIEEILPVEIGQSPERFRPGSFQIEVTDAGLRHPITKLGADEEAVRQLWANMTPLAGYNPVLRARDGAVVLGVHPRVRTMSGPQPILAVQRYGKGRTLGFLTDSFWKWNFEMVGRGKSHQSYLKFVRQMIRWLVGDPKLQQVRIATDARQYRPGETARLKVVALGEDYAPVADAVLSIAVTTPRGDTYPLDYLPGKVAGEFVAELPLDEAGIYRAEVVARRGGQVLGRAESSILALVTDFERDVPSPDETLLVTLAEASGGTYLPFPVAGEEVVKAGSALFKAEAERRLVEGRTAVIWDRPLTLLLFLPLVAGEWAYRRWNGLS